MMMSGRGCWVSGFLACVADSYMGGMTALQVLRNHIGNAVWHHTEALQRRPKRLAGAARPLGLGSKPADCQY
jgi:hypothetical protein